MIIFVHFEQQFDHTVKSQISLNILTVSLQSFIKRSEIFFNKR